MKPEVVDELKKHAERHEELQKKLIDLDQRIKACVPQEMKDAMDTLKQEFEAFNQSFNSWLQQQTGIPDQEATNVHLAKVLWKLNDQPLIHI